MCVCVMGDAAYVIVIAGFEKSHLWPLPVLYSTTGEADHVSVGIVNKY